MDDRKALPRRRLILVYEDDLYAALRQLMASLFDKFTHNPSDEISVAEASDLLGCSQSYVRRLIRERQIDAVRDTNARTGRRPYKVALSSVLEFKSNRDRIRNN